MPRYFFHLTFGRRTVPDEEGVELPNRTAAREEALAVVRDLANPELRGNPRRWASWFLEVADATGGFFRTPIGHPALEIVSPQTKTRGAEEPEAQPLWLVPVVPDSGALARTAEIVREMAAHRQVTAQLLKRNEQLRRELSSICLASEAIRIRANRLVSLFHAARTRF
jgi:hypothetical protein